ncbi:MAG: hypothetical protein HY393_00100 [Candidatus Diapherotrites archaeon]|nr:hypothetical protein [Candidatus Diapherotrites archaeon]
MHARGFYYLTEFLIGFALLTGLLALSPVSEPLALEKTLVQARLNDALKVWAFQPPPTPEEAWEDLEKMFPAYSKTLKWGEETFGNPNPKSEGVASEGILYTPNPIQVKIMVYLHAPDPV